MEAGESARQRISSASNPRNILNDDYYDQARDRDADSRDPRDSSIGSSNRDRDASTMATAALISPNTPHYPHHPSSSYSSGSYYQGQHGQQQSHQQQQQGSQGGHHSYHQQEHAHSHGQASPTATAAGMISPVESRRTSDDHDMSGNNSGGHRQSLPSLKDVIGKNPPSSYHPSSHPAPSSTTPSGPPPQQNSLPSPFSTSAPARPFPAESPSDMQQQHSPRAMQHPPPFGQRPEPSSSSFPAPPRPPLSRRASPPLSGDSSLSQHSQQGGGPSSMQSILHSQPPSSSQHAPMYPPHPSQQQQHSPHPSHHQRPQDQPPYHHGPPPPRDGRPHDDSPPPHHAYPPHPSHHQQHPPYPPQSSAQQPLPPPPPNQSHMSYPGSPRHSGPPSLPSPFESHAPPMQEPPVDYNRSRNRYDQTVSRHFESWNYTEYLARIGSNSRTIYNFAEAFGSLAREEHGPHPMPGRMPSDREVLEMISNAEWLKTMLESLRHMVHEVNEGRSGNGGNGNGSGSSAGNGGRQKNMDDMDMSMYNDQGNKPYGGMEVKKRRGRAAPPGRCHSCNRIDTPEWRRGPDGARTLCNACGLHYAKLERKKQLESRQIRPKHPDSR
ncbi:hypothetical protein SBRCBS47491_007700 [Sporothrix bragantina]|uniref:GATA-type domain-containing protein n=1 Tax=Sporothrix bragantina TaxID=671064 RepID=A0ABP0CGK8_9PEZI